MTRRAGATFIRGMDYVTFDRFPDGKTKVGKVVEDFKLPAGFWVPGGRCAALNDDRAGREVCYLFCGDRYVTFNWATRTCSTPASLAEWNLPGAFLKGVSAATNGRGSYTGKAYFFVDALWVAYDWASNTCGDAKKTQDTDDQGNFTSSAWNLPWEFCSNPRGGVNGQDGGRRANTAYFIKGSMFVRYSWSTEKADQKAEGLGFLPGPFSNGVIAAMEGSLFGAPLPVAVAPGSNATADTLLAKINAIESYILALEVQCGIIQGYYAQIHKALAHRLRCKHSMKAVLALTTVCLNQDKLISGSAIEDINTLFKAINKAYDDSKISDLKDVLTPDFVKRNAWASIPGVWDFDAALRSSGQFLVEMLTSADHEHAKTKKRWSKFIYDEKLTDHARYKELNKRMIEAEAEGVRLVGELNRDESLCDRMFGYVLNAPAEGATAALEALDGSVVEQTLKLMGSSASLSLQLYGNTAGPPSLSISVLQAASQAKFAAAAEKARAGDKTALLGLLGKLKEGMKGVLAGDAKLAGEVTQAIEKNDFKKLFDLRTKYGEHVASRAQVGTGAKSAVGILAMASLLIQLASAANSQTPIATMDYFNILGAGAQASLVTAEVYLQGLGRLGTHGAGLAKLGMGLGMGTCVLGFVAGVMSLTDEKSDGVDKVAGVLNVFGNFAVFMSLIASAAGSPLPGLNVVGQILLVAGMALALYKILTDPDFKMGGVNRVFVSLLGAMEQNELFAAAKAADANVGVVHARLVAYFKDADAGNDISQLRKLEYPFKDLKKQGFGAKELSLVFGDGPFEGMPSFFGG